MGGANLSVRSRPVPAAILQALSCPPNLPLTRARVAPTDTTESPIMLLTSVTLETMVRRGKMKSKAKRKVKAALHLSSDRGTFNPWGKLGKTLAKQISDLFVKIRKHTVFQTEETGRGTESTCTREIATSRGRETGITPMTSIVTRITTRTGGPMETRTAAQAATATTAPLGKGRTTSTATTGTTGDIGPIMTGQHWLILNIVSNCVVVLVIGLGIETSF